MLFEIQDNGGGKFSISSRSRSRSSAVELGLREKDIEVWLATHPQLLLPNEQVLVIGCSIAGESMADSLALDSFGRLVIVEIKRGRTGRETVAQLLGYAARMQESTYEELNAIAQRYDAGPELHKRFLEFNDGQAIPPEQLGREQRVIIVASDSDDNLKQVVGWLASYGVPLQFVPFSIYAEDGKPRYLGINGVVSSPDPPDPRRNGLDIGSSTRTRRTHPGRTQGCLRKMWRRFTAIRTVVGICREPIQRI